MSRIVRLPHASWTAPASPEIADTAAALLEEGRVLFLPALSFPTGGDHLQIFSPSILSSSKNASFDPASGRLGGTTLEGAPREALRRYVARYSDAAATLVDGLLPRYRGRIVRARASFRPAEIAGRAASWRKDDSRLHVDSFPASPVQGRRILRVFCNVNPSARPRTWRVGGAFDATAARFAPALSLPWPGVNPLLHALRVTRSRRTAYDSLMLQLHDRMKEDAEFQAQAEQERFDFPAGSTWLTFTDEVGHAAMAGQYQLEQTFLLPVEAMADETRAPLRILERLKGRRLV